VEEEGRRGGQGGVERSQPALAGFEDGGRGHSQEYGRSVEVRKQILPQDIQKAEFSGWHLGISLARLTLDW
jgi:hypothetical protein